MTNDRRKTFATPLGELVEFIPGYAVDREGNVYSLSSRWPSYGVRKLNPCVSEKGYMKIGCGRAGQRRVYLVHRAVAIAFLGEQPSPRHQIRHLNGIKRDNRVSNLAWGTSKENAADKRLHGTLANGSRNGSAKLRESQVIEIRRLIGTGASQAEIARMYGVTEANISGIKLGKSWKHLQSVDQEG